MSLQRVHMAGDVYMVCCQHALSTELEEVMGLLIGHVDVDNISYISALVMLRRSDKRKDRVEISPEQLTHAAIQAERLSQELDKPMRVVGWYHSHPHITVWPSHVDVRTQAMYQTMDECFIGIIFSAFSEDKTSKDQQIQTTCFQSVTSPGGDTQRVEIPLFIDSCDLSRPCLESMVELPEILLQEEKDSFELTERIKSLNVLAQLYNRSALTKSLCRITEEVSGPIVTALEQRRADNVKRLADLRNENQRLLFVKVVKEEPRST